MLDHVLFEAPGAILLSVFPASVLVHIVDDPLGLFPEVIKVIFLVPEVSIVPGEGYGGLKVYDHNVFAKGTTLR